MENVTLTIVVALLSSSALSALITGLFQAHRDKQSKKDGAEAKIEAVVEKQDEIINTQNEIKNTLKKQEIDQIRTEMKMMIYNDPSKEEDLLRMGQHYFVDLDANWTMGRTYVDWLKSRNIEIPGWVKED